MNNWINIATIVLLAGMGVYIGYNIIRRYRKVTASQSWPQTVGTIRQAQTKWRRTSKGGTKYWAAFKFVYSVIGAEHEGEFKIENFLSTSGSAEASAAKHPEGSSINVRYNPQNPTEYVTEFEKAFQADVIWFVLLVVLLVVYIVTQFLP